jgi:hypothetical protein
MRTALLLPDGFGIRNFVLSGFLKKLSASSDVLIFHSARDPLTDIYSHGIDGRVEWLPLYQFEETATSFLLRRTLHYAHMHWAKTQSMRNVLKRHPVGSWKSRLMQRIAKVVGAAFSFPRGILFLDRIHTNIFRKTTTYAAYREFFQKYKPDLLFCSNQWSPQTGPAVVAAQDLGIRTAAFIFSWDNLTSKGRVIVPFDEYLVWSPLMQEELLRYYPDVSKEQIHIVGTPQFDFYADESLRWSREEFCKRIGADSSRPIIAYCGGHHSTHPDEEKYLREIVKMIREGTIAGNPQIVFRPAPTDRFDRFDDVLREFSEIILSKPYWDIPDTQETLYSPAPLPEDMELLTNLLYHADVNINIASTMTIDSAIFDRPVINPAFDLTDPLPHGKPLWEYYYQFEHYRAVVSLCAASFPSSIDELASDVQSYLDDPSLDRDGRRKLIELEIGQPIGTGGDRLLQTLTGIATK